MAFAICRTRELSWLDYGCVWRHAKFSQSMTGISGKCFLGVALPKTPSAAYLRREGVAPLRVLAGLLLAAAAATRQQRAAARTASVSRSGGGRGRGALGVLS